jgi:hypothetical protein
VQIGSDVLALFIACVGSGYAQRVVLPLPPDDPLI